MLISIYPCVCERGQRKASDDSELEFQEFICHSVWVLVTKFKFFERVESIPKDWVISPATQHQFKRATLAGFTSSVVE